LPIEVGLKVKVISSQTMHTVKPIRCGLVKPLLPL